MKKIKTVTFTFERNDFPKKGEWFSANGNYLIAPHHFTEVMYDIYTKTETEEVWKPKAGEGYYYVNMYSTISSLCWQNDKQDNDLLRLGNCFQTESEAQAMADKFKELLKGN